MESIVGAITCYEGLSLILFDCLYIRPVLCLSGPASVHSHTFANQEILRRNKNKTISQAL